MHISEYLELAQSSKTIRVSYWHTKQTPEIVELLKSNGYEVLLVNKKNNFIEITIK